jgi:hypothetical protein
MQFLQEIGCNFFKKLLLEQKQTMCRASNEKKKRKKEMYPQVLTSIPKKLSLEKARKKEEEDYLQKEIMFAYYDF